MSEIIAAFDLSKVQKAGGSFDEEKLRWMNKQYMAKLSDEEYLERLEKIFKSKDEGLRLGTFDFRLLSKSLPIIRDRAHTFGDIIEMFDREGELGFVSALEPYDPKKLPGKGDTAAAASVHLEKIIDLLAPLADFSADEVKKSVWPYASEKGRGSVLWPMRFALTGREKSPDPFLSASILGKEETIKRLRAARALLG